MRWNSSNCLLEHIFSVPAGTTIPQIKDLKWAGFQTEYRKGYQSTTRTTTLERKTLTQSYIQIGISVLLFHPYLFFTFYSKDGEKNPTDLLGDKNSHRKVESNGHWRHLTFQSCVLTEGFSTSQFSFLTNVWPIFFSTPPEESRTLPFYIIAKLQSEFLSHTWKQCVTVLSQVWKQNK